MTKSQRARIVALARAEAKSGRDSWALMDDISEAYGEVYARARAEAERSQ